MHKDGGMSAISANDRKLCHNILSVKRTIPFALYQKGFKFATTQNIRLNKRILVHIPFRRQHIRN